MFRINNDTRSEQIGEIILKKKRQTADEQFEAQWLLYSIALIFDDKRSKFHSQLDWGNIERRLSIPQENLYVTQ